jgi:hypothetical protein
MDGRARVGQFVFTLELHENGFFLFLVPVLYYSGTSKIIYITWATS